MCRCRLPVRLPNIGVRSFRPTYRPASVWLGRWLDDAAWSTPLLLVGRLLEYGRADADCGRGRRPPGQPRRQRIRATRRVSPRLLRCLLLLVGGCCLGDESVEVERGQRRVILLSRREERHQNERRTGRTGERRPGDRRAHAQADADVGTSAAGKNEARGKKKSRGKFKCARSKRSREGEETKTCSKDIN